MCNIIAVEITHAVHACVLHKINDVYTYIFLCADIDECLKEDACHTMATCTNTEGSYECKCLSGYSGDGHECLGERRKNSSLHSFCLINEQRM